MNSLLSFSPCLLSPFHSLQILRNAVSKTYNRISDLRKEIASLKKDVALTQEAAAKAKADLEAAESKLTLVDGEPVLGENPARTNRLKLQAEKTKKEEVSAQETLEAKEALFVRAVDENEVCFIRLTVLSQFSILDLAAIFSLHYCNVMKWMLSFENLKNLVGTKTKKKA